MTAVTTLPWGRPLSRADLDALPDDGHRYELLDGALIVTPAPNPLHQRVVLNLAVALRGVAPPGTEVLVAPLDVALAEDTLLQPDVILARASDLTTRGLQGAPLLAVEVASPSTRRMDLTLKRSRYEAAGCRAYWVVDPDARSITAWERRGRGFVRIAHVTGEETFQAASPVVVSLTAASLLRPA